MRRKTRKYIDLTTQENIFILNLKDAQYYILISSRGKGKAYADAKLRELGKTKED